MSALLGCAATKTSNLPERVCNRHSAVFCFKEEAGEEQPDESSKLTWTCSLERNGPSAEMWLFHLSTAYALCMPFTLLINLMHLAMQESCAASVYQRYSSLSRHVASQVTWGARRWKTILGQVQLRCGASTCPLHALCILPAPGL